MFIKIGSHLLRKTSASSLRQQPCIPLDENVNVKHTGGKKYNRKNNKPICYSGADVVVSRREGSELNLLRKPILRFIWPVR